MKWVRFLAIIFLFLSVHTVSAQETHTYYEVRMTENGFEPEEIEINVGDTVEFLNESNENRWPATNIHPTHTVYPGSDIRKCSTDEAEQLFDSCTAVLPGDSYAFTFTEPGNWKYHDHVLPRFSGIVVVTGEVETESFFSKFTMWIREIFSLLRDTVLDMFEKETVDLNEVHIFGNTDDEELLRRALKANGATAVMQRLLDETEGGSAFDCHQEAHDVGRAAYRLFGAEVFSEGDASCHSGFYHGAMESLLVEEGTQGLAQNIDAICSSFPTSFGVFECLHGVGHGLLAYENYDLPASLDLCDELEDSWSASSCYGGVFMENVITGQGYGAVDGHETPWLSEEDLHFPCNAVGDEDSRLRECYKMQTSWMLTVLNYDFEKLAPVCLRAPEAVRDSCYLSFGRDAAGQSLRDPDEIIRICGLVPKGQDFYDNCIQGGVNVIIDFWGPRLENQANELCTRIADEDSKMACFGVIQSRVPDLVEGAI